MSRTHTDMDSLNNKVLKLFCWKPLESLKDSLFSRMDLSRRCWPGQLPQ